MRYSLEDMMFLMFELSPLQKNSQLQKLTVRLPSPLPNRAIFNESHALLDTYVYALHDPCLLFGWMQPGVL